MSRKAALSLFLVLLILAGTVSAGAQVRIEANVSWPISIGFKSGNDLFSGSDIDLSGYHFLLPDFRIYYQFGEGLIQGGVGARAYTALIETFLFPEAFVELNLNPIVVEASLGGLLYGFIGLYNNLTTSSIVIPDFNVGWQVIPWLRIGGGVLLLTPLSGSWSQNYVSMVYVGARFIFLPK